MKKKIKDLTLEECRKICARSSSCYNCPFFDDNLRKCRPVIDLLDWEQEVEVDD